MREKSATWATSLSNGGLLSNQPANDPFGTVDFNEIAIAKPLGYSRDGYDGRNSQLARYDRRMRKEAASFDDDAGGRGEKQNPAGIRALCHENAARTQ